MHVGPGPCWEAHTAPQTLYMDLRGQFAAGKGHEKGREGTDEKEVKGRDGHEPREKKANSAPRRGNGRKHRVVQRKGGVASPNTAGKIRLCTLTPALLGLQFLFFGRDIGGGRSFKVEGQEWGLESYPSGVQERLVEAVFSPRS